MPVPCRVFTDRLPAGFDPEQDPAIDLAERIDFQLTDTGGFHPRGMRQYLALLKTIRRRCRGMKFQAVHAARVLPEGWLAWLGSRFGGPPYWCFAHGEEINLDGAERGGVMSSRQHRWMAKLVFRGATGIIANSHNTGRMLREQWHIPNAKIHVVHPGVDAEFFRPCNDMRAVRQSLGLSEGSVLLTVGRLQRRKGHHLLLRALPELIAKLGRVTYVIAGAGEEETALKGEALALGVQDHVRWFHKFDDETLRRLYQACDVFVLPNCQIGSDVEGFGMVLLEAAACGKPTITGITGGTQEAVVHGKTGLCIDPTDSKAMTTAIIQLLTNPIQATAMGTMGRERIVQEFAWPSITAELVKSLSATKPIATN